MTGYFSNIGGGANALVKSGAGVMRFSELSANTYTGATTVSEGTLLVNGSLANTTTTVDGGAILGGDGTIGGPVSLSDLATLSPGPISGAVGTLTLNNSLTLLSGAELAFDLASVAASDKVSMASQTLYLNGLQWSDMTFDVLAGFGAGTYTLIDASSISGSLGSNVTGTVGGLAATLGISAGKDLVLTVTSVPEPGTMVLLAAGLISLIAYAWRRRK